MRLGHCSECLQPVEGGLSGAWWHLGVSCHGRKPVFVEHWWLIGPRRIYCGGCGMRKPR